MGRRTRPLPGTPDRAIFTVAEARAAAVTDSLRHPFVTPSRGLRMLPDETPPLLDLLRCHALVLPDDIAFSHETAAAVHELPIPLGVDPGRPIHTVRPTTAPPITRRGVRTHRGLEARVVVERHDLPVTSVLDTWSDLALRWSRGRTLALGDALLRDHGVTPVQVARHLEALDGRRGIRRLRELAPLLRPGSRSPKESEMRLVFHDELLPEPELNVDLFTDDGEWLAMPDYVWRTQKVVGEYDGDQHRTDRESWQYERDRRARLEDHGWVYVEMTQTHLHDLTRQLQLLARLRTLLT